MRILSKTKKPVDRIVSVFQFLKEEDKETALVCVINNERTDEQGYLLGVATRDELGYKTTNYVLGTDDYNEASEWVDKANKEIFGRDPKETFEIVASTMRRAR